MRYFNGFSLQGEEAFFREFLIESDLCVSGFSYGAQQAFEYVYNTTRRVDRLILLSPAFFQHQKPSFLRTQLRYFKSGEEAYIKQFLANAAYPSEDDLSASLHTGTYEELESLLTYRWESEKISEILARGTTIEVFLGSEDRIIDAAAAFDFFARHAVTYLIKGAGHLLRD
ncbi:pimelyl-ACP methyl ester esterase BioV [Sulfurovum mangrovi]|uniref:pimelyl-ACP methyl ester esterase BioV n=1 Tax=Sulfurovum mangrovi TaxID=2893889 RepID=UPI001E531FE0|nr:pimelyl-ACP methyl ester esterase BioV [Sulfurovum mangrovi]UFH60076.1 pimelyl-ACP methyl ester esterase BioV [Sulfurovum mangrovi]